MFNIFFFFFFFFFCVANITSILYSSRQSWHSAHAVTEYQEIIYECIQESEIERLSQNYFCLLMCCGVRGKKKFHEHLVTLSLF